MTPAEQILANVKEIAPGIAARAQEVEAARTLPRDIVRKLVDAGVMRMMTPKSHGGPEIDFPSALEVMRECARADGSTGWAVIIGCGTPVLFSRMTRAAFDRVYSAGPDIIQAGTIHALGKAEIVSGGYRVTGRWPFGSGCKHADWILGGCKIFKDGKPVEGRLPGTQLERIVTMPASDWRIEDTWYSSGLKGSGSHHYGVTDAFIPQDQVFDLAGPACVEGPLFEAVGPMIPMFHAALALGIAEGALADIIAIADTGKRAYRTRSALKDSPIFQYELGRAEADVRAARAFMTVQSRELWQRALDRTINDPRVFSAAMQMEVWLTATCVRAIDLCYTLGGGNSLYDSSPLQRRLRDIHTATQHVATAQRHFAMAGATLLGLPAIY